MSNHRHPNTNVRLLLHTEDGSFPYLSDYLLKNYFNPKDDLVKDHLTLGIAVKDTCVVPTYPTEVKDKCLKRKRSMADDGNDANVVAKNNIMKPCGYTFDAKPIRDLNIMLPQYNTMVVPSFDLLDDARSSVPVGNTKGQNKQHNAMGGKGFGKFPNVASTKAKISLITPNGMQQISPSMYAEVGMKLRCDSIIALFDQADVNDGKNRKTCATERTKEWLDECLSTVTLKQGGNHVCLWGALSYNGSSELLLDSINFLSHMQNSLKGISIVGWHHIPQRQERITLLKKMGQHFAQGTQLCVLATSSLEQIIDAAQNGVRTIGTSLPVIWARSNKAMIVEFNSLKQTEPMLDRDGCIDMSLDIYRSSSSPILQDCLCPACRDARYSRAYIHHLIKSNELLAQILLFGHNLYQMLLLFEKLSNGSCDVQLDVFVQEADD
jgi:tRNA-guanine family transglycosylase